MSKDIIRTRRFLNPANVKLSKWFHPVYGLLHVPTLIGICHLKGSYYFQYIHTIKYEAVQIFLNKVASQSLWFQMESVHFMRKTSFAVELTKTLSSPISFLTRATLLRSSSWFRPTFTLKRVKPSARASLHN